MIVTVLHNQSILDIAIQYTGMVENSFDIAVYNGLSVSDSLSSGMNITIPEGIDTDVDVINDFSSKILQPATGITDESIVPTGKGIGWMQVGTSFKVS